MTSSDTLDIILMLGKGKTWLQSIQNYFSPFCWHVDTLSYVLSPQKSNFFFFCDHNPFTAKPAKKLHLMENQGTKGIFQNFILFWDTGGKAKL